MPRIESMPRSPSSHPIPSDTQNQRITRVALAWIAFSVLSYATLPLPIAHICVIATGALAISLLFPQQMPSGRDRRDSNSSSNSPPRPAVVLANMEYQQRGGAALPAVVHVRVEDPNAGTNRGRAVVPPPQTGSTTALAPDGVSLPAIDAILSRQPPAQAQNMHRTSARRAPAQTRALGESLASRVPPPLSWVDVARRTLPEDEERRRVVQPPLTTGGTRAPAQMRE